MSSPPLVTRFAPSPIGLLHLGNARTALLNFLAARKSGGRFILRVEDSGDQGGPEAVMDELLADLRWLGLSWDEGPDIGGPQSIYRQRHRRAIYEAWLAKLDAAGLTYPCFCTTAQLNASRREQLARGKLPRYAGTCRLLTESQRCERLVRGQAAAVRFKVPDNAFVSFADVVHGERKFSTEQIGDFIIRRADGATAFFVSSAIDDALMGVTLVMRGDDHLDKTPRQLLILAALGLPAPRYAHVALLLGMDGAPLSRKHGDLSLQDLRRRGFHASAVRNLLVRLGHSCATNEWLNDRDLIAGFDLSRLTCSAAKCDETLLRHWQREAVNHLSDDDFIQWTSDQLPPGLSQEQRRAFALAIRHDVELQRDAKHWADVIFGKLGAYSDAARRIIREATPAFFVAASEAFARAADVAQAIRDISMKTNREESFLYMTLRAALIGDSQGPELGALLRFIAQDEVQARLAAARQVAE